MTGSPADRPPPEEPVGAEPPAGEPVPDDARPDEPGPSEPRPDEARPDAPGPDEPGPDEPGPDAPLPDESLPADVAAGRPGAAADAPAARRRRPERLAAVLIGFLTLLLGFAFAVQVRSTDGDQALAGSREEDLVRILDDLTGREDRLRQQIAEQRAALAQLNGADSTSAAALEEASRRAETLGILNGTVAAQGPGLEMTIGDPARRISAAVLLKAVQELRAAGAETMQVDDVRIGTSTAVTGSPGDLRLDGRPVPAPYVFKVIGSPQDMATAMNIPNGVARTVRLRDGTIDVVQSDRVVVDALRALETPQYAEPSGGR
jgi:uncharacterized protein YlxW (UPF0749 family)